MPEMLTGIWMVECFINGQIVDGLTSLSFFVLLTVWLAVGSSTWFSLVTVEWHTCLNCISFCTTLLHYWIYP